MSGILWGICFCIMCLLLVELSFVCRNEWERLANHTHTHLCIALFLFATTHLLASVTDCYNHVLHDNVDWHVATRHPVCNPSGLFLYGLLEGMNLLT